MGIVATLFATRWPEGTLPVASAAALTVCYACRVLRRELVLAAMLAWWMLANVERYVVLLTWLSYLAI